MMGLIQAARCCSFQTEIGAQLQLRTGVYQWERSRSVKIENVTEDKAERGGCQHEC